MQVSRAQGRRRHAALALSVLLVASACSALAEEQLAVVPGTPWPDATAAAARRTEVPSEVPASSPRTPRGEPSASQAPDERPRKPKPKVLRLRPRPAPGAFEMNLFRRGDFMHQASKEWCVAGSTQIMMNIIGDGRANRSVAFQGRLYERGRQLSPNKRKLGPIGVDLMGWAALLNTGGYGPYVVDGANTRRGAIQKAARALRLTGRPVGLVTWRGAHSWVMSGFTATADPAFSDRFSVKAVYIQDTWYPSVSSIWGASHPPNTLVSVAGLAPDYLPYQRPRARWPKRDGKFMLILPVLPKNTVAR